jgi:hypothetical protein
MCKGSNKLKLQILNFLGELQDVQRRKMIEELKNCNLNNTIMKFTSPCKHVPRMEDILTCKQKMEVPTHSYSPRKQNRPLTASSMRAGTVRGVMVASVLQ